MSGTVLRKAIPILSDVPHDTLAPLTMNRTSVSFDNLGRFGLTNERTHLIRTKTKSNRVVAKEYFWKGGFTG